MKNALLGIGLLLFALGFTNFIIFTHPSKLLSIGFLAAGIIMIVASNLLKKAE